MLLATLDKGWPPQLQLVLSRPFASASTAPVHVLWRHSGSFVLQQRAMQCPSNITSNSSWSDDDSDQYNSHGGAAAADNAHSVDALDCTEVDGNRLGTNAEVANTTGADTSTAAAAAAIGGGADGSTVPSTSAHPASEFILCNRMFTGRLGHLRLSVQLFPHVKPGDSVSGLICFCLHSSDWHPAEYISSTQKNQAAAAGLQQPTVTLGPYSATIKRAANIIMEVMGLTAVEGDAPGVEIKQALGEAQEQGWVVVLQDKVGCLYNLLMLTLTASAGCIKPCSWRGQKCLPAPTPEQVKTQLCRAGSVECSWHDVS